MAKGRHHEVTGVVREGVEDYEDSFVAIENVILGQPGAEDTLIIVGCGAHVLHSPRAPEALHQTDRSTRLSAISTPSFSTKSVTGTARVSSPDRLLTDTVPDETSSSPTTS